MDQNSIAQYIEEGLKEEKVTYDFNASFFEEKDVLKCLLLYSMTFKMEGLFYPQKIMVYLHIWRFLVNASSWAFNWRWVFGVDCIFL